MLRSMHMAQLGDKGDGETTSDVPFGDEFAARLATVVFEWRPTRLSSVPPPVSELWMSRSARPSERTPS
jgi:hypothetical protein